eukprot:TRINITY_DN16145_c0_g1_i2.p1 TRINITY_DN16145_c0_g1~~TRINITY_DN16145_c0_g1_i2.p1  ORF type:complete len:300 (-),score=59.97 TRINITY_DN16145_c0_g1_i2:133-1032(-)
MCIRDRPREGLRQILTAIPRPAQLLTTRAACRALRAALGLTGYWAASLCPRVCFSEDNTEIDLQSVLGCGPVSLHSCMLQLADFLFEEQDGAVLPPGPGCAHRIAKRVQPQHWDAVLQVLCPRFLQHAAWPGCLAVLCELNVLCTRADPDDAALLARYRMLCAQVAAGAVQGAVRRPLHHMDVLYHDSQLDYSSNTSEGLHLDQSQQSMRDQQGNRLDLTDTYHGAWPAMVSGWPAWDCSVCAVGGLDWKHRRFGLSFGLSGVWPRRNDGTGGARWEMVRVPATQMLFAEERTLSLIHI